MLSPADIKNKKFDLEKKKYYDAYQVDEFLEEIRKDYTTVTDENVELRKKIKTLSEGIQYYRSMESTLQNALLLAEKTSSETKQAAKVKAEQIEQEANDKAKSIIAEADQEAILIKEQYRDLIENFNRFKSQCQQAAKAQLELLTGELFSAPSLKSLEEDTPVYNTEPEEVPEVEEPETPTPSAEYAQPQNNFYVPPVEEEFSAEVEAASSNEENLEAISDDLINPTNVAKDADVSISTPQEEETVYKKTTYTNVMDVKPIEVKTKPVSSFDSLKTNESDKKLNSLLNDLNKNSPKKSNESDPFEFLGSIDKF